MSDSCNCQAVPGTTVYPGPWHPAGDTPSCPTPTPDTRRMAEEIGAEVWTVAGTKIEHVRFRGSSSCASGCPGCAFEAQAIEFRPSSTPDTAAPAVLRAHPEPAGDLALEPVAADSAELAQWLAGRAGMDPVRATLAYRLRLARRLAGLTTHDATLAAGFGTTTIARWESGDRTPSAVMLSVLARVYGQPLGWFFPDQHVEGEVVDLAVAFGSLSRRDQKTVSMLIKYLLGRGEDDDL